MSRSRHDELREAVIRFHEKHPEVWELFKKFTFERINKGFKNYSSDAIFHRIRWEMSLPEYEKGKEFKMNDHYTAFYARAFMERFPKFEGFFRTRKQPSKESPAVCLPELGPDDFD